MRTHANPADRFWAKVVKTETCWLWQGHLRKGYGRFSLGGGSRMLVHRWAYEAAKGAIPAGLQLDHLCRVRNCVNPDHLEAVTPYENCMRGQSFAVENAQRLFCPRGHRYGPPGPKGTRECRECARRSSRESARARYVPRPPRTPKPNCKNGHPLDGPDVAVRTSSGWTVRVCLICQRERDARWRAKATVHH
jgi:hypothetical protein